MDIFNPTEIEKAVGATVTVRGVALKVLSRAKCEYAPDKDSTYYNAETPEGATVLLNAHTVHGILSGESSEEEEAPKEPSKRERARLLVKEQLKTGEASSVVIAKLMLELELSKATATSYFYSLKN